MPEETISSEVLDSDHKSSSRHRWRAKLSRSGGKAPKDDDSRDQEIESFLHIPTNVQNAAAIPRPSLEAQRNLNKSPEASLPESRRKPTRKPNLRVTFATTAPIIIGEGGDEATLPAIEVLSFLDSFTEPGFVTSGEIEDQLPRTLHASDDTEAYDKGDNLFRPRSLQRRSTGFRNDDQNEIPEHESQSTSRYQELYTVPNRITQREIISQDSSSPRRLPARSSPHLDENLMRHDGDDTGELEGEDTFRKDSGSLQAPPALLNPPTSIANSLTPSPSPQYPRRSSVSPDSGYPFPAPTSSSEPKMTSSDHRSQKPVKQQQPQQAPSQMKADSRGLSLRNIVKNFGDDALQDFAARVRPFRSVFLLGLDNRAEPTLEQWIRAAGWWFVRGRSELEESVRSKAKSAVLDETNPLEIPQNLKQAYVDLAKACWITSEITPNRYSEVKELENKGSVPVSSILQSFVDAKTAELIQRHLSIVSNLRALTMSMRRNNRMPPSGLELQGSDVRIFIAYPSLSPSAARLLSSEQSGMVADDEHARNPSFFPMPISDTDRHFNYGRMFVDMFLDQAKPKSQIRIPCLLSVLRDRRDRDITVVVASQDGQVHLVIQPDVNRIPSWRNVQWKTQYRCIEVDLRADIDLRVQFTERDFKTVWGIHDYIRTVQKQSQASRTEVLVLEDTLRSFQYFEHSKTPIHFPAEAIEGCTLRLFECFSVVMEGSGERRVHDGHRLMVVTPRKVKTLSSVSHHIGKQTPIVFSYLRDDQGAPAILLKKSKSSRDPSLVMSFQEQVDRELLYTLLSGTGLSRDEHCSDAFSLEKIKVLTNPDHEDSSVKELGNLGSFRWRSIKVFRQELQQMQLGGPQVRIWAECQTGSIMDRINLGPGELQIRLHSDSLNRISISRPPQRDMTVCFGDDALSKEQYEALRQMLDGIGQSPLVKTFGFHSLKDMHAFQGLVTGFSVLFDGFARTFAISRRRMVVPIHKRWEASVTRMQIVRRDKTTQLLAFFKDFSHGSCMSLTLKSTDVFESFSRSGIAYLSIVDAKFALPKSETDRNHNFVCLDMPEYPGEHDDITIGFGSEHGKSFSV
ncbi:MAG: hypothetical protein Q9166_003175 [cf. Caloplaca sp. 2 TL-2023]